MSKLYAGFIKAERERECVTVPAYCLADDIKHAERTLRTWAKERWPVDKGWKFQQGFAREVIDEAIFMDERVMPLVRLANTLT